MNEEQAAALHVLEMADTSHSSWGRGKCPFCLSRTGKEDKRGSFSVNADTGAYQCFKCGAKGRIPGNRFRNVRRAKITTTVINKPQEFTPLHSEPGLSSWTLQPARTYLSNRDIDIDIWKEANIGACPQGYFSNRILVPIMDKKNRNWEGFVARDWTGEALQKYLYPKGMHRGSIMFQQHILQEKTDQPVIVVEGVFDALPYLGQAVACLGKPTHAQFSMLCKAQRPVVVALDGDAWEEGYVLSQKLILNGVWSGYVKIPPGHDPGSIDRGWFLSEVKKSIS